MPFSVYRPSMDNQARPMIAIVDDNVDNCEMLVMLLEAEGYRAQGFFNAAEAFRSFQECPPDAALLDYAMPEMTGGELARLLRSSPATAHIKLIAETARPEEEVLASFPFDAILSKPFSMHELLRSLPARVRLVAENATGADTAIGA